MSRIGAELTNTFVDDILSEATVDSWDSFHKRFESFVDTVTFGKGNAARVEKFLKEKIFHPIRKTALREIPMPKKIKQRASESLQTRIGRIGRNACLTAINHPAARFVATAGIIAGITMAIGFPPLAAATTIAAAYAIKIASAYAFMGIKYAWKKLRKKGGANLSDKKQSSSRVEKFRAAMRNVSEVAFGVGQKNPYLNLLDVVMTVTSGVLLIPTCAQLNIWIANALRAAPPASGTGQVLSSAGVAQLSEAAEQGMVRNASAGAMRQAGRQAVAGLAEQEILAVSRGMVPRMVSALAALPERIFGVFGQGTIKYLGGNLARKYAPDLTDDAALMAVAASTGAIAALRAVHDTVMPPRHAQKPVRKSSKSVGVKKIESPPCDLITAWARYNLMRVMQL